MEKKKNILKTGHLIYTTKAFYYLNIYMLERTHIIKLAFLSGFILLLMALQIQ